jgi:hypothetical protein
LEEPDEEEKRVAGLRLSAMAIAAILLMVAIVVGLG